MMDVLEVVLLGAGALGAAGVAFVWCWYILDMVRKRRQ